MKAPKFLLRSLILAAIPMAANAAGTYYNGAYQSPQTARYNTRGYNSPMAAGGYSQYSTYNRTTSYGQNPQRQNQQNTQRNAEPKKAAAPKKTESAENGFFINGTLGREYAMWQFEMDEAASILHYDNIAWNVFNLKGGYVFDAGNTKVLIDAGFKYGFQAGDATMIDDDISNGGFDEYDLCDGDVVNGKCTGTTIGSVSSHALSIGTSKSGSMLGFNLGVGLPGIFTAGNVKFTPSIGYRYFKYKLETSQNYGVQVDTGKCFVTELGDLQCDPIVFFTDGKGNDSVTDFERPDMDTYPEVPGNYPYYDTEGTYYYMQPGTSHSYEVAWSGPYIAMDMEYQINKTNQINGRIELGFPGYTATGDQPYRFDWEHPKSVEDKAGMFSAMHLGLGANWITALSDTVSLSVGVTYDYYTVSGADATTYLNRSFYQDILDDHYDAWQENYGSTTGANDPDTGDPTIVYIEELESECPGWVCKSGGEIDSFYRSLGVHVGLSAKF